MADENRRSALFWGVAGALGGVLLAWAFGIGRGVPVKAQAATPAEAAGTIAFTVAGPNSAQLFYLIDTRNQSFAIYRVDPQELKGTVKLEAARQYRWDLKLAEFNNQPPEVSAVEAMVGAPRR